jgi:beta-lactam-binding protein with PASTA domain
MAKTSSFFNSKKLRFHLLLMLLVTIVLCVAAIIFLHFYTRHGEDVEMPDFVGQDSDELLQNIRSNDFILVVSDQIFDKKEKEGIVLKQNPASGEMVKKGRKVYLTIASAEPPKVKMPELQDVSLRQAEIMLKAIGLNLGEVIYKPSPYENAILDQIYRGRHINAGSMISYGEKISLVVGKSTENMIADTIQ